MAQTHSKHDISKRAYKEINAYFDLHRGMRVEICIIPSELLPANSVCVDEGCNIGVPKKVLALAFVEARSRFFDSTQEQGVLSKIAFEATRIILLYDPEHLTAANFRKRFILQSRASTSRPSTDLLAEEELMLDSILTSPLHRQTKSPTLWYHRLWLLRLRLSADHTTLQPHAVAATELKIVCEAGERHPNNYYAWQYARHSLKLLIGAYGRDFVGVELLGTIKSWCCVNPGDVSGWSFLAWLLRAVHNRDPTDMAGADIVMMVIKYASAAALRNQSLWRFVDLVSADGTLTNAELKLASDCLRGHPRPKSID